MGVIRTLTNKCTMAQHLATDIATYRQNQPRGPFSENCIVPFPLSNVHFVVYSVQSAVCNVQYAECSVQCAVCNIECVVFSL